MAERLTIPQRVTQLRQMDHEIRDLTCDSHSATLDLGGGLLLQGILSPGTGERWAIHWLGESEGTDPREAFAAAEPLFRAAADKLKFLLGGGAG